MIQIKNLPPFLTTTDLYELFCIYGSILECELCFNDDGSSKRFAYIRYSHYDASNEAIRVLQNQDIEGYKIRVTHVYCSNR
jgi:RNA recognition motif-containing protein